MKNLARIFAGALLVATNAACSQQAAEEGAVNAPTETAEEFVARANTELVDLSAEGNAAAWVRSTYITEDTTRSGELVFGAFDDADYHEGRAAFLEKRKPEWKNC